MESIAASYETGGALHPRFFISLTVLECPLAVGPNNLPSGGYSIPDNSYDEFALIKCSKQLYLIKCTQTLWTGSGAWRPLRTDVIVSFCLFMYDLNNA